MSAPYTDYIKLLAAEYQSQVKQIENPDDPNQLHEAFTNEIEWFNEHMSTAVKLIKDKSPKTVAKTAMKEVSDIVHIFVFYVLLTEYSKYRRKNGKSFMVSSSGDG